MASHRRSQDSSITPKRRSRAGSLFEDSVNDTRSSLQRSSAAFLEWHQGAGSDRRQRTSFGDVSMAPADLRGLSRMPSGQSAATPLLRRGYQKSVTHDLQMEEEVRTLSEQNYRIEEECRELANQVRELKTECDTLELSLEESRREKQDLEEHQEPGRETFHELATAADSLRESEQEALHELNVLQARIDRAKQESSAKLWKSMFTEEQAKKKSAKLEQRVTNLQDELVTAKEERQKRLQEALVLREELKDAKEALDVEKDKTRLARFPSDASPPGMNVAGTGESLFDQLNVARNPDLIEEVEELQEQLERCEKQGASMHLSAEEEMAKVAALRDELKQRHHAFEELEALHEKEGSDAAGRLAELSDKLNQGAEESAALREMHATVQSTLQTLQLEHLEEEEAKTARAAMLQNELEQLQEEKRQCLATLAQLEQESAGERKQHQLQQQMHQEQSQQAQALHEALKAELQAADEANASHGANHARLLGIHKDLEEKLQQWEAQEASGTRTITELRKSLEMATEQHGALAVMEQEQASEVDAWSQSWWRLNERHKETLHLEEHQRSQSEHLAQSLRAAHEELSQMETSLQKAVRRYHDLDSQLLEQRSCTLRYEKDEKILEERAATLAVNVRQAITDLRSRKESQESAQQELANEEMRCSELEVALSSVQVQLGCAQQDSVDKECRLKTEGTQIQALQSELDWYVNEAQMHQRLRDETLGAELASIKLDRLQDELFPQNRAVLSSLATEESAEEAMKASKDAVGAEGSGLSGEALNLEHVLRQRLFLGMLSQSFSSTAKRTSSPVPTVSMSHTGLSPQSSGQPDPTDPNDVPLRRLVAAPSVQPNSPCVLLLPPKKVRMPGAIVLPPPSLQEVSPLASPLQRLARPVS